MYFSHIICYSEPASKVTGQVLPVISSHNLVFQDVIGKGNFAVVYKGKWVEKTVALKKMRLPRGITDETLPNIQEIRILRYNIL